MRGKFFCRKKVAGEKKKFYYVNKNKKYKVQITSPDLTRAKKKKKNNNLNGFPPHTLILFSKFKQILSYIAPSANWKYKIETILISEPIQHL